MSEEIRKLFPKDMKYIEAQPIANYIEQLQQENQQLKEIIDELYQELSIIDDDTMKTCKIYDVNGIPLKKILDKAKGEDNE